MSTRFLLLLIILLLPAPMLAQDHTPAPADHQPDAHQTDTHQADAAHGEAAAHGAESGEVDINAVGHSADGYYLDFSPMGVVELPRLLLVRDADGSIGFDVFGSTHAALEAPDYGLAAPGGMPLSVRQVEQAIMHHDHLYFDLARTEGDILVDLSITRHLVFLLLGALLLLIIALSLARRYAKGIGRTGAPRGKWQNMVETLLVFIRDEVAKPTIGEGYKKYMPYLYTVFFLILICNWLGLVPWGASATSNVMVTGTLAIFTFLFVLFSGTREYYSHMFNPPGVPLVVKFILAPMEVIGLFTRHIALAFRLFGNMVSGHLVLVSILGLIFICAAQYGSGVGFSVALLVSVPLTVFIFALKLAVGIIQAYVFTILSSLFIGLALEEHEHGHDEHPEGEQYGEYALDKADAYVPDRAHSLEEALEEGGRRRELAEATV